MTIISGGDFVLNAPSAKVDSTGRLINQTQSGQSDPSTYQIGGDAEVRLRDYTRRNFDERLGTQTPLDPTDVVPRALLQLDLPPEFFYRHDVAQLPGSAFDSGSEIEPGVFATGNVYITARVLNVNGRIQSGQGSRDLTINNSANAKIESLASELAGTTEIVAVPRSENGTTIYTGDIDLFYDPVQNRLQSDQVRFQGGYIFLKGQIVSTGDGRIEVLDGYGDVQIRNFSNVELFVPQIDTGDGISGQIDIVDTDGINQDVRREVSLKRDGPRNTSLEVLPAQLISRYLYSRSLQATQRYKGPEARLRELGDPVNREDLPRNVEPIGGLTNVSRGPVLQQDNALLDSFFTDGAAFDGDYVMLVDPFRLTSYEQTLGDIIDIPFENDERDRTSTATMQYFVNSYTRANQSIDIQFIGRDTASIEILGGPAPITTGTLIARDGNVSVTTSGGVGVADFPIRQESDTAIVIADNVTLRGSEIIGRDDRLHSDEGLPVGFRIDLSNPDSTLTANATGGDAAIVELDGGLHVGDELRATGQIQLHVESGDLRSVDAAVIGESVRLMVPSGVIGTNSNPLNISAGNALNASANGDIYVTSPQVLPIDTIHSQGGNVSVNGESDIVDANTEDVPDVRAEQAILRLFDDARLIGVGADEVSAIVVDDLIAGKQVDYAVYWDMRGRSFDAESQIYTFDEFDPNFVYQPNSLEIENLDEIGMPTAQYIERKTTQYFQLHVEFGNAAYDPNFRYTPSTGEVNARLAGNRWTQRQLDNFVDLTAIAGLGQLPVIDTEFLLESPNIIGNDVFLVSAEGGIGNTTAPFVYRESTFDALSIARQNEILIRLGAALPSDINDTGDLVEIVRREDLDISATGELLAVAQDAIYVGSDGSNDRRGDLHLRAITSLDGEVRLKISGDVTLATETSGIFAGSGEILVESSGGKIAATDQPLNLRSDSGEIQLVARSQDGIDASSNVPLNVNLAFTQGPLTLRTTDNSNLRFSGPAIASSITLHSDADIESRSSGGVLSSDQIQVFAVGRFIADLSVDEGQFTGNATTIDVIAHDGDLEVGDSQANEISINAADGDLRFQPGATVNALLQTTAGTLSLRGQNVLLPETTVLKTNGSGRAFIDLESSSTDASNIHLLGEIDASNLQIVGNNGPNEIIIGDRVGRTVRVFSVGGD
ncbi:MAG: hypothetical protein AAFP69_14530, partial [Planctomycetota bacterium]